MNTSVEPLRFAPLLKRIRWGGRRLGTRLGKPIGPEHDYAESWEVVDHGSDQSVVANGPWQGRTLHDLVRDEADRLLGRDAGLPAFPLLIKFLDANDRLSVQVHPNDEQAPRYVPGERGKTEAWVILEAEPESCVFAGLKPGIHREELAAALAAGRVEECLHRLPVRPGDCVFIPAGTVHALGEGVLLAEVQQSSDLTFRLFDWNRLGTDGRPRPLHIEQSLECIDFQRGPVSPCKPELVDEQGGVRVERLARCPYFTLRRYRGAGPLELSTGNRCAVWIVVAGGVRWSEQGRAERGQTLLWPAATPRGRVTLEPQTEVIEAVWE